VRGVPLWSILLAFVIGEISFLPFPSWQSLVGVVTSATAIMYAFAPVSLAALRLRDPERPRPYQLPFPKVLAPVGFVFANLIIYWGGFETTWKLLIGLFIGRVLFEVNRAYTKQEDQPEIDWRASSWIWPWLIGLAIVGLIGRYGTGSQNILPNWWDLLVVIAFALVVFYWAVSLAQPAAKVLETVRAQQDELLAEEEELGNVA
jgi:amino acid transporter